LDNSLFFGQNGSKPAWKDQYELSTTGDDYNHTFAMLRLKGPSATVEYFQVPPNRAAQSMGTPCVASSSFGKASILAARGHEQKSSVIIYRKGLDLETGSTWLPQVSPTVPANFLAV
jgi:hypothetical protein